MGLSPEAGPERYHAVIISCHKEAVALKFSLLTAARLPLGSSGLLLNDPHYTGLCACNLVVEMQSWVRPYPFQRLQQRVKRSQHRPGARAIPVLSGGAS